MPALLKAQASLYEIKEVLGESPLSCVYLAYRLDKVLKFKQKVVLKVFKQFKSDEKLPALQMESLARIRHSPYLVKILGFERIQNQPALVLEYIAGLNLKQLLQKTRLNLDEKYYICEQVLNGLEELNSKGLVHGDLSFSNILIALNGKVYLTDYGLANYAGKYVYSTKPFTAPELDSSKACSFQSDLFSLGVLEKLLLNSSSIEDMVHIENSHFCVSGDPLLDPQPQKRKKKAFSFCLSAGSSLGEKVHQAMSFKNSFFISQPLSFFQKKAGKFDVLKNAGFIMFFIFCVLTSNPFVMFGKILPDKAEIAQIFIRTKQWMYIQLADKTGYSPLAVSLSQPGTYQVKWKNHLSQGTKYIQVQSGDKIILRDHDFP